MYDKLVSVNTFFGKSDTDESKALLRAPALARDILPKPEYSVTVVDTTTNHCHINLYVKRHKP